MIRLRAIFQHVGDGRLVGGVKVLVGNGDDAFLFWATCSTGTSAIVRGSTGALEWGVDLPVDDGRGGYVKGIYLLLGSFPVVLAGEAGFRLPDGSTPVVYPPALVPPPHLDFPGAEGGTKDGTAAGSWAAGFGPTIDCPWRAWRLPYCPLPPCVSKHQRDRAPVTIKSKSELGQQAQSRQYRPQGVV